MTPRPPSSTSPLIPPSALSWGTVAGSAYAVISISNPASIGWLTSCSPDCARPQSITLPHMALETNSPPVVRKLLFVTNSFSYGGSEKHLLEILKTIDVERVQVIILCIDSDPYTERLDGKLRTHVIVRVEKSLKSL